MANVFLTTFVVVFLLSSGFGPYLIVTAFTDIAPAAILLICFCSKFLGLVLYRWQRSRTNLSESLDQWFQTFESWHPVICITELFASVYIFVPLDSPIAPGGPWLDHPIFLMFLILVLDVIVFLFLSAMLGPMHLGQFGSVNTSVYRFLCQTLHSISEILHDTSAILQNISELFASRQSATESLPSVTPSISSSGPLPPTSSSSNIPDSVSPPPSYTYYYSPKHLPIASDIV